MSTIRMDEDQNINFPRASYAQRKSKFKIDNHAIAEKEEENDESSDSSE